MANAREQMKMIETELARVREQLGKLQAQEEMLHTLLKRMAGETEVDEPKQARKRAGSVKPFVIDAMREAGFAGATSNEVDTIVRRSVPDVAKDTVGSLLSRLKADGALVYDGVRYYEKQFAPRANNPFEASAHAVN